MNSRFVVQIMAICCLIFMGCIKKAEPSQSVVEGFPTSIPDYKNLRFKKLIDEKFSLAKKINEKFRVGPRLRFDEYLDNNGEAYFPCWDYGPTGLVDPQGSVCAELETDDSRKYCTCEKGVGGLRKDCLCLYPEEHAAEKEAIQAAIDAARDVTLLASQNGYSFTVEPLELYLVFLGEAGFTPISVNQFDNIDGYTYLGIDNISESPSKPFRSKYIKWAPPEFKKWMENSAKIAGGLNELDETFYSPENFDIRNGMYAMATEYAYSKAFADDKIYSASKQHIEQLPRRGQLYWAYIYFNAGENAGIKVNVNRFDTPSTKDDNYSKNLQSATFNGSVRTSTYAYWRELCKNNLGIAPILCQTSSD